MNPLADPIKMVYGMSSTRVDDDIVEEVMDALDDVEEEEWEILAWRRSAATRMIIRASVRTRTIQSDSGLNIKIMPLGHILDDMRDPRNDWLVPAKVPKGTPFDSAQRNADKWSAKLWPEEIQDLVKQAQDGELSDLADHMRGDDKPRIAVVKTNPQLDVLAAFGLTGDETAEDGSSFGLVSYAEKDS